MKTLVLLVNFGTPRNADDVPRFLKEMAGHDAPRSVVSAVSDRYRAIGGTSPLAVVTDQQAILLAEKTGNRFPILSAYRYSRPALAERIEEALKGDYEHLVFFVMSPYYSSRTTGDYVKVVEECIGGQSRKPKVTFLHGWCNEAAFIDCWASMVRAESPGGEPFYIFSAHSLPLSASEPYKFQVEETVQRIAAKLGLSDNYAVGWQSVAQKTNEPWIGPSVESLLDGLVGRFREVVEVPVGFVADHLETRYDMDIVHREYARSLGLDFSRVPSLNTYAPFISALAVILEKALGGRA